MSFGSVSYVIRIRDAIDTQQIHDSSDAEEAVMPLLRAAYVRSLEKRNGRLQPKFFADLSQVLHSCLRTQTS